MRKYKLLAADMDGTLLNDKKEITPKTLASINRMISNGGVFCLSTGRPLIGVLKYCEQIKGNIPLILYNGAIVRFSKDSAPIVSRCLSKSQSESILSVIKQRYFSSTIPCVYQCTGHDSNEVCASSDYEFPCRVIPYKVTD